MNSKKNDNQPVTGVFIFSKEMKNDGEIVSRGGRPITHIETNKYSGRGKVHSIQTNQEKEKWHKTWWGVILIGLLVTIIGGVILFLITK